MMIDAITNQLEDMRRTVARVKTTTEAERALSNVADELCRIILQIVVAVNDCRTEIKNLKNMESGSHGRLTEAHGGDNDGSA